MKFFRFVLSAKVFSLLVPVIALSTPVLALHGDSLAVPAASITVMTRNLYVGASFSIFLGISTPDDVPDRVAKVYGKILSSRFPWRAEAIADEIVQNQPDVVSLQEAFLLLGQSPSEVSSANQPQPAAVAMDYLQILLDALQRRDAHYAIAAIANNTDITAPNTNGDTIRLIDRNVILVRTDLPPGEMVVSNPQAKNFDMKVTLELAGIDVTLLRSWCSVDVRVRGKSVRIVNTHLEEEFFDLIQFLQADELLAGPFRTNLPVIVLGDFNASESSTTYKNILKAGFKDSWPLVHPGDPGFSCCQDEDLLNRTSQLKERIDLVLFRGGQINVYDIKLVGVNSSNRIPSGQWPSDHAGVVAALCIK
jgi:endonuclease/exonuclease/phosphatase family metal-dependent hydrolase